MSVTVIQDLRWGDTGKGKISEYMSNPERCDVSVRAIGGGNAGHVIVRGTRKIALHILPAGCVHPEIDLVLGRGMVTHLPTLFSDMKEAQMKFDTDPESRLVIAPENHILFNGHKSADAAFEQRKGEGKIGTTGSGIGPAYSDKALRIGLRMEDLRNSPNILKDRYHALLSHWTIDYGATLSENQEAEDVASLLQAKERLERYVQKDMTTYWQKKFAQQARIVIEGAQGSLLNIDGEGYPYVTSSATTTNGHLQGAGIPARELTDVIGTLKAYDTRVGNGPMRTEMEPEIAARIQERGGERGSTTGRVRRVGWLDVEDAHRRVWEESVTKLAILKGDILDEERQILLATHTQGNGTPFYSNNEGWMQPTRGMQDFGQLPRKARHFYQGIAHGVGAPIGFIGTGPESSELIVME